MTVGSASLVTIPGHIILIWSTEYFIFCGWGQPGFVPLSVQGHNLLYDIPSKWRDNYRFWPLLIFFNFMKIYDLGFTRMYTNHVSRKKTGPKDVDLGDYYLPQFALYNWRLIFNGFVLLPWASIITNVQISCVAQCGLNFPNNKRQQLALKSYSHSATSISFILKLLNHHWTQLSISSERLSLHSIRWNVNKQLKGRESAIQFHSPIAICQRSWKSRLRCKRTI